MTTNNIIPTLWAGSLLKNLNDAHVYARVVNRDYEGDIREHGDSVKISTIGRVTISTYTLGSTISAPERMQDSALWLIIDQGEYFNFIIHDADKAQQKPKIMGDAMREASWGIGDSIDVFLATLLQAGVATAGPDNTLTAVTLGTGAGDDDAYETLVDLDVKLTESNAPTGDRWCVIPPWVHGLLRKDPRFVSFGTPENLAVARGKPIGRIANLTLHESNNVPLSSTTYTLIAGYKGACTFAEQVASVEAFRPPDDFGDAVKGLYIYGGKVTRPYALASVDADQA